MSKRRPVSSLDYIRIPVVEAGGADPTDNVVELAFPLQGAAPSDWTTAAWENDGAIHYAKLLLGPGGALELPVGDYDVWVRVAASPEEPVLPSDKLSIYAGATAFASVPELCDLMGKALEPDDARASLLLELSTQAIKDAARQTFALVIDDQVTLYETHGRREIKLPERPVLDVSSVQLNGLNLTGYTVTKRGVRWLWGDPFQIEGYSINAPELEADGEPVVTVTYSHGYALAVGEIPEENPLGIELLPGSIKGICLAAAARAFQNPQGIVQESVGIREVQYGGALGVALTDDEKKTLARIRVGTS